MFAAAMPDPSPLSRSDDINFEELLQTLDAHFASLPTTLFERFGFELDGIAVEVRRVKQDKNDRFLITAMLGQLPFTIESPERRQAIRAIVEAARTLPTVHFTIDATGKITAGGLFDVGGLVSPDFIFYPLSLFLQEARPFMQLIGRYIAHN